MEKKFKKKYYPGKADYSDPQHLSFIEYIRIKSELIRQHRIDLTHENTETVINANSPFEWCPTINPPQKGILLIHGLLDSPFTVQDIGRHFLNQGFLVRAILLPGHGTIPGDLLTVSHQDWLREVAYGIDSFSQDIETLYVLGISAGAAMAIYHAIGNPKIKGLFLLAPAIKLQSRFAFAGALLKHLGKLHPAAGWHKLMADSDYSKYESYPYHLVAEAYRLTREINRKTKETPLTIPLFMVTSTDDETISSDAAHVFFSRYTHPQSRLIIYGNEKLALSDPRVEQRQSAYPEENILNFSHVCLPVSPDNPHYGRDGDYRIPHPSTPSTSNLPCHLGALPEKAPSDKQLYRLTYNPDFKGLLERIDWFLQK